MNNIVKKNWNGGSALAAARQTPLPTLTQKPPAETQSRRADT